MGNKNQAKKRIERRAPAPVGQQQPNAATTIQIPRPRVTDRVFIASVPHLAPGVPTGAASGGYGDYEVTLVLGVPGISSVSTAMDIPTLLAAGDSLLEGDGLDIDLQGANGCGRLTATVLPNAQHRLARIVLTVLAKDFADAERMAFDNMSTMLSRIAFHADTAIEVSAIVVVEKASRIVHASITVIGSVQPVPVSELEGWSTEELRPFLAAYREGLNSPNAPLYQALSFYKVIEGAMKFHTNRSRAAVKAKLPPPPHPLDAVIPADVAQLPDDPWGNDAFTPYLGMTFADVEKNVGKTIRDGAAHIAPGMKEMRIADMAEDLRACRELVPVLRYMARRLIEGEMAHANASAYSPV